VFLYALGSLAATLRVQIEGAQPSLPTGLTIATALYVVAA
jgi:hypothetical protein